jgi:hypothetical protein
LIRYSHKFIRSYSTNVNGKSVIDTGTRMKLSKTNKNQNNHRLKVMVRWRVSRERGKKIESCKSVKYHLEINVPDPASDLVS